MASGDDVSKYVVPAVILLVCACWSLKDSDWWLIHVRYADADSVTLQPKPIDCDWDTSPQGEKGCHYQRYIFVDKDGDKVTRVYGSWKRVADNQEPTVVNRSRAAAPAPTDAKAIADCINRNYALRTSQAQNQAIVDGCAKDTTFTIDPYVEFGGHEIKDQKDGGAGKTPLSGGSR